MSSQFNFDVAAASQRLKAVVNHTPLTYHKRLSNKYGCNIYLKREDLQPVRSYKLRGAYNKIESLSYHEYKNGIVCASAGNHAQGVAYTCNHLEIVCHVFMPANTPAQKINRVLSLGGEYVKLILEGDDYDSCAAQALQYSIDHGLPLIPPFDDMKIIEGQATVGLEILKDLPDVEYIFIPVGGGGLAAGIGKYFKQRSPATILIGVEPAGAASMTAAFECCRPVALEKIDPFIDGAAVKRVGELTYQLCNETLEEVHRVAEGKVCATLLSLYNEDGIITEPAASLSVAALDDFAPDIKGKNVVCIISGSNNDSNRIEEIKKLASAWEGLQHHLIIRFQHNPDGLTTFFKEMLGPTDYVNRIEYMRRDHGRSTYALVGIRCNSFRDYLALTKRLKESGTEFRAVQPEDFLFKYWV